MQGIEQIYTSCLAQGAYFIESEGEAIVIDPLRDPKPYLDRSKERDVSIKYILETHFHADFVSGHLDLAKATGATIVFGPGAETAFEKHEAKDGEILHVGKLKIKVIHTPGHTPESTTYLLFDEEGREHAIFTGDTLFIGDVGRPDLAQKATGLTQEDLAGWLFDSLRNKIMPLHDDVIVYPAHGAGSSCGKNMSSETWDTLGNQKKTNYALRADMTRTEFIQEVTDGLMAPPQYFAKNAGMNKKGYDSFSEAMERGMNPYDIPTFKALIADEEVLLLDVRDKEDFIKGFIPGSLFIGLGGSFAPWVGALITDLHQKIALVCPVGKEEEAIMRLARVGYDHAIGYLEGGFETWRNAGEEIDHIDTISVEDFANSKQQGQIVDVRKPTEFETTHLVDAINIPLDFYTDHHFKGMDTDDAYMVHCRSGYRSTIATSLMKKVGVDRLTNVHGSFDFIKVNMSVEGSCPSLMV